LISTTGNVTGANITGTHFGNGATLNNIVTSISAGTGISVNASTGAVTITATGGGGGGTSISDGTTNIRINGVNGNILANVGPYANVANISAGALPYPLVDLRAGVNILSQTGSYNTVNPFDGGILTTGAASLAGAATFTSTGIFLNKSVQVSTSLSADSLTSNFVTGNNFISPLTTVTQGSSGSPGQMRWDANYIYVCTAVNTWKRVALTTY